MISSKKNFIGILVLYVSINQATWSAPSLFEQAFYQPSLEIHLKSGNHRTLARGSVLIPWHLSEAGLWFTQIWGLWNNDIAKEWNVGLGYRYPWLHWIAGAYGCFDRQLSPLNHYHSQVTFGVELLGKNLEMRFNGYIPTTTTKVIRSGTSHKVQQTSLEPIHNLEKALGGVEIETGGYLPSFKPLQGFLTYYHFNGRGIKAIHGLRLRGQLSLTDYIALTAESRYDRLRNHHWFMGIQLKFSIAHLAKQSGLSKKIMQTVIRDIDIVTDYCTNKIVPAYPKHPTKPPATLHLITTSSAKVIKKSSIPLATKPFLEVKQFTASSSIRAQIQSILIYSPTDIWLKPKLFPSKQIAIAPYDIQGIPACKHFESLSYFTHYSYWRIHALDQGYGVKAHLKGLGGADTEEDMDHSQTQPTPITSFVFHDPGESPFPNHRSHLLHFTQPQSQVTRSAHSAQTSDSAAVFQYEHYQAPLSIPSPEVPKPKALGERPAIHAHFIARQNAQGDGILDLIKAQFAHSKRKLTKQVIAGNSGLGKTQLAIQYIMQNDATYDGIFWLQADAITNSYLSYAEALSLNCKSIELNVLEKMVHQHLRLSGYKKVLWIYDNVPNAMIFNKTLFDYKLKKIWNEVDTIVHILITSEHQTWEEITCHRPLLFDKLHTTAYVASSFKQDLAFLPKSTDDEIAQLNRLLGGLPLAIAQALNYLSHKQDGTDINDYIKIYKAHYNQAPWVKYLPENLHHDHKILWTIWEITRKNLSKEATLLLQMCCFLSNCSISKLLFSPLWADKVHVLVKELANYALIQFNNNDESFRIHTLLQKILQLQQSDDLVALKQAYALATEAAALVDKKEPSTWLKAKCWSPHISSLLVWIKDINLKSHLLLDYGKIADFLERYVEANDYYSQVLALQKNQSNPDNGALADMLQRLGYNHYNLGNYVQAKNYLQKAFTLYRRQPDKNSAELVVLVETLGAAILKLGHYKAAKTQLLKALAYRSHYYGENHIMLTTTLTYLSDIELQLENYEMARNYLLRALSVQIAHYGEDHITIAQTLIKIAQVALKLGHYDNAKIYYHQALALQTRHYEKDCIQMLSPLVKLCEIEQRLNHDEAAKNYLLKILTLQINHYGSNHIELAATLNKLGEIEFKLGHYENAEKYYSQILVLQSYYWGSNNSEITHTLYALGVTESKLGHYHTSKQHLTQALGSQTQLYSEEHAIVASTLLNLGNVELQLGHDTIAKNYYDKALALKIHHYGIELVPALGCLGNITFHLGQYETAKSYYTQALNIQTCHYGQHHFTTAPMLIGLGNIASELGQYDIAKNHYNQALALQVCHYGPEHIETACTLHNLGIVEFDLDHYEEAYHYYTQALTLKTAYYGADHIELANTLVGLGEIQQKLGYYQKAYDYVEKALSLQHKYYSNAPIQLSYTYNVLSRIYLSLHMLDKAFNYQQMALNLCSNYYPPEHIKFADIWLNLGHIHFVQDKPYSALIYYQRALTIQKTHYGALHIKSLDALENIVKTYQKLNKAEQVQYYTEQINAITKI